MVKLVEIGGLLKKGLGQNVVKKFAENSEVISVGFANGRASDMFDIQQFGDASEADILTLIVKEKKSNAKKRKLMKMKWVLVDLHRGAVFDVPPLQLY